MFTQPPSLGTPVELDQIDRELKKLWADESGAITRASLINLAVYSEEADSLARNTRLLSQITDEHACRALVIAFDFEAPADTAEAWINAHCHAAGERKKICSEQISFRLGDAKLLPSILFSHLDSDLPLYLWWQAELPEKIDPQLWTWVDRLIFDSRDWRDFNAQMQRAESAKQEATGRHTVLCDLNWARIYHFRLALAQFFDHPQAVARLHQIQNVSLAHGRGFRSTGLLFIGWLAAQLGWEFRGDNGQTRFTDSAGGSVTVELSEEGEMPLHSLVLRAGEEEFFVRQAECGDLLEAGRGKAGTQSAQQLLPGDKADLATLVSEELMRGGDRRTYGRAVEKVRALL